MNQQIKITVTNKIATTDFTEVVTFNSVYSLKFVFDEEWEGFSSRVAVVKWPGGAKEKLFSGTECVMPEIDSEDAEQVLIGVYSIKGDERIASSFVQIRCEPGTGSRLEPKPVRTLHDQVLALLNEERTTLDSSLQIGDKTFDGSESVVVTADDLGLAQVALSGSYNDLTDKPETEAAVTSVNGKTGEVTVTKFDLGLAEVAISGSYTDLKDKPEGVTSVNGQTGDVTVDKDTLGLAPVATSGKYTDLTDVPETGVVSVNGHSGQVELTAEDLQLGALAKLDQVGINDIKKDAVLETHIRKFAVSEEKLHDSAVVTRSIKDGTVTALKLADETVKAGAGASVTRQEDGSFLVGLDASGVVTSVNGQTGAVTVDAETMGLADVAFSGKFSDLIDAPESGVLSVNGKTGAVTVDAASLGLAAVATSGKYSDLTDVPEQAVLSVNGMTGEVVLDADNLQLGALAKLDQVGMNNIKKDAVLETHIRKFAVSEEKLHDNAVVTRSLKDAAVTASKLAEDVIKAQDGLSVSREEGGAYLVGLDTAGFVSSVNGQAGAVEITKETLGLKNVTSERQMPLAADTRMGADFDTLFPNGFYHILGTDEDPCTNNPVSMQNTSGIDCSWFLLVMATHDNSSAVQVAFSARKDFSIRMRCFSEGAWSDWQNIPS